MIGIGFGIMPGGSGKRGNSVIYDSFNRADSSTTAGNADTGQPWTAASGTWGIDTNRVYSVSDASGDLLTQDAKQSDFTVTCTTNGQTASSLNYRYLNVAFHVIDNSNYLMTRVNNGNCQLYKNVAGVFTNIAQVAFADVDNTDYKFTVNCAGNIIKVYIDDVLQITYTLMGGETTFATATKVGIRLSKGGTPTGTARADLFSLS